MIKVKILGSGGAFDSDSSSYLIDNHTLVDCSENTILSLIKSKEIDSITDVFFTHIHQDHVSGLEKLLYYFLIKNEFKDDINLKIHAHQDVYDYYKTLGVLKSPFGGLYSFDFEVLEKNWRSTIYTKEGLGFTKIPTIHMNGTIDSYGYVITKRDIKSKWLEKSVFITSDMDSPLDYLSKEVLNSMVVFHDMGFTCIDKKYNKYKFHCSEQEVYDIYGEDENIIGIHTSSNLKYYRKANKGDIFYI